MPLDIKSMRKRFPALSIKDNGRARVYLDNPGGTQVPVDVIDAISDCLIRCNANLGGAFRSTKLADQVVEDAHTAMADFLNANDVQEIIFGQNMTSLTMQLSRSLAPLFKPGDEVIVSRMDHDANVSPWLLLAQDLGLNVKWLDFDTHKFEFDLSQLDELLTDKTKLIAVGYASNLTGTVHDVKAIAAKAKSVGALCFIDAVQFAPHGFIDVQDLGCDFLVCSPYKFFGPHQGVLWGRKDLLESLHAYKVRPAPNDASGKFETGTLSHEAMAGTTAVVNYFAEIGQNMAQAHMDKHSMYPERRAYIRAAFDLLRGYEDQLTLRLIEGLRGMNGVTIQGITNPDDIARRVPTISFSVEGLDPSVISEALARDNIFVWSGHNYAIEAVDKLGLKDKGGILRIGIAHYNTADEIDLTLAAIKRVLMS